ncbi:MAG: serine dehydratase [Zunongwangia sp.]|jgi:threonine dehydratase|uniref:Serine racemase n=1 Tax=Zunongwangia profunda (strain DSM 18752 / CCTCC AB 206139 / SM-A87) TaxID=655815 RepID=D5BKP0_ZUNPS|nr:pyridoxal-phosphate dependent enzyme [Zunongwangia profunda]MAG87174.1 serine dehydratase [Flavobacteriaceae bacterium]MAO35251.1 serine dehydratase [Zunongwangia sp.]ADF53952.1 serine racemase [Zunongwangia profunda SM-A87]MAS70538.1 serine dehydratase [Zunongwangia sp.]MCC4229868.1 pyridoxal-phosphate dependent enzyme [Zunongwangia profunda]|tara:strand:- start:626 stop:1570 length:945 start_codon:yes stop_codon:yes gene_type:complete
MEVFTKERLLQVHERISPYIHETPILTSRLINEIADCSIYFKCENFQKMGAFKMRGATNAILQLSQEDQKKGVVTHSSGNFAQALSLAAKSLGITAYIVMPSSAPQVKKDAVKTYGGIIIECPPTLKNREETAQKIVEEKGATFVHPSNDIEVILGQGTAALELLQKQPHLDLVITPIGGGGLIGGTALAVNLFAKSAKTIGAEPFEVDDAYRSLISGTIETNQSTNTIADGLKTQLGDQNFPIIQKHVEEIIRVTEEEIKNALKLIWERMKIIVEPSSAVALAAVLKEPAKFKNKQIGVIISGGNVDFNQIQL